MFRIVLQAKNAANSTVRLASSTQDKIKQCQQCDNEASGTAKQFLKTTDACKLKEEATRVHTSSFSLEDVDAYTNESCDPLKVSVRILCLLTNI